MRFSILSTEIHATLPVLRGYNIGTRLIEDFLARTSMPRCADFRETAEVISKVRFQVRCRSCPS